jgi:signal transduction histidine kinase
MTGSRVSFRSVLASGRAWARRHRGTLRLRLTVLYGALFLASGVGLLAITYALVARRPTGNLYVVKGVVPMSNEGLQDFPFADLAPTGMHDQVERQSAAVLHQLLVQSVIALIIMAIVSVALGWFMAGRALRPLRTIADAAESISSSSLDRRLELSGPNDELHRLGTTFNGLLERLGHSFDAQRQFVANASHELRTPLTVSRTTLEVALADPAATVDSLRAACERALASGSQQEHLIEALLTLARSERGLERHEKFDMADIALHVTDSRRDEARSKHLVLTTSLSTAPISGDPRLIERLVVNLVSNAFTHNIEDGIVRVSTYWREGRCVLFVQNTGPVVESSDIERMIQPFQRASGARADHSGGLGLGLSIAQAVVKAHDATMKITPIQDGGLEVVVMFPPEQR